MVSGRLTFARLLISCGVQMLAVSDLEDALTLRRAGVESTAAIADTAL